MDVLSRLRSMISTLFKANSRRAVAITFSNEPFIYDGQPHELAYEVLGLPEGYRFELVPRQAYVDATDGPVPFEVERYAVYSQSGKDVTSRFDVTLANAFITVRPATLEVTTESASKTYDGKDLTAGASLRGLVGDETVTLMATGRQTEVCKSSNSFVLRFDGTARKYNYEVAERLGTLEVLAADMAAATNECVSAAGGEAPSCEPHEHGTMPLSIVPLKRQRRTLSVVVRSGSFVYDGRVHVARVDVLDVPPGFRVAAIYASATVRDVSDGTIEASIDGLLVTDSHDADVTDSFDIKVYPGVIAVAPADISHGDRFEVMEIPDAVYDGQEHRPTPRIHDRLRDIDLIPGEGLHATWPEDLTNVGRVDLELSGTGNYAGTVACGFSIRPKRLNVITLGGRKRYDGRPLTACSGAKLLGCVDGDEAILTVTGSCTEVGSSLNTYSVEFVDPAKQDNYEVHESLGTLTVKPAPLKLEVIGTIITYDGKPHSAAVRVGALPPGYTAEARSLATVTEVSQGLVNARVDLLIVRDATGRDVTSMFEPDVYAGSIRVMPADIKEKGRFVFSSLHDEPYDGQEHLQSVTIRDAAVGVDLVPDVDFTLEYSEDLIDVGKVSVTARGLGNYAGSKTLSFRIEPKTLLVTTSSASKAYDGKPLRAGASITGLVEGETVELQVKGLQTLVGTSDNDYALGWDGTASEGNYDVLPIIGSLTVKPANISEGSRFSISRAEDVCYDGLEHRPAIVVHDEVTHEDLAPSDVSVTYPKDVTNAGTKTITITGRGNYTGKVVRKFHIKPVEARERFGMLPDKPAGPRKRRLAAVVRSGAFTYDGRSHGARVEFVYLPKDYKVGPVYASTTVSEVREGVVDATVDGFVIRDLHGADVTKLFDIDVYPGRISIAPANISNDDRFVITPPDSVVYDGLEHRPVVRVYDKVVDAGLLVGVGFEVEYPEDVTHVGVVSLRLVGQDNYCGSRTVSFRIKPADVADDTRFVISCPEDVTYDGREHRPEIVIHDRVTDHDLLSSEMELTYPADLLNAGAKSVSVAGRGNYSGTVEVTFHIRRAALNVITLDGKKRYDGSPLRAKQGGGLYGLVGEETATFVVTGAQTAVGTVQNSYSLRFDGTARESNYEVREHLGTLTVEPAPPTKRSADMQRAPKEFRARPVDKRPDLEEMGLGWGFHPFPNLEVGPLPDDASFVITLRTTEPRARRAIGLLSQREDGGLLFRCFDGFDTDLERMQDAFRGLLNYYRRDMRQALVHVDKGFRNAFLICVADLARTHFDGQALWKNLFPTIDVVSEPCQRAFQSMFISYLYQSGLPVFETRERHRYIMETAVLHGGLTQDIWEGMWRNSFLPLAEDALRGMGGLRPSSSGDEVLAELTDGNSPHRLRGIARSLFQKVPPSMVASTCGDAWKVALEASSNTAAYDMVTSYGLSVTAMQALRSVVEAQGGSPTKGKGLERLVYVDQVDMELDVSCGLVTIAWQRMQFPLNFEGNRMDFYVNGVRRKSEVITRLTGRCVLEGGFIAIEPSPWYDVEVRLMVSGKDGEWVERSSRMQSFQESRPGCFEFIGDELPDGSLRYRFRKPDERLRRTRRLAYLVKPGLRVEGRRRMRLLNKSRATGGWDGMSVFEYEVDAGACGAIISIGDGEEIVAWHEQFRASVDTSWSIGLLEDGTDVYGFSSLLEGRPLLPTVFLDVPDVDDIDVSLLVDGRRESPPSIETDPQSKRRGGETLVKLVLSDVAVPSMSSRCELVVRQVSMDAVVLRYHFAVVPVSDLRLADGKALLGDSRGIYEFVAMEPMTVRHIAGENDDEELVAGQQHNFEEPLSAEVERIEITTAGHAPMRLDLNLVGISLDASQELREAEGKGPICLATCEDLGIMGGDVKLSTRSPRHGRDVSVMMGEHELVHKDLSRTSDLTVNLFDDPGVFRQKGKVAKRIDLTLRITYGIKHLEGRIVPSTVRLPFLNCVEGLGFSRFGIVERRMEDGTVKPAVVFAGFDGGKSIPAPFDLHFDFSDARLGHAIGGCDVLAGTEYVPLPPGVAERYEVRRPIQVRMYGFSSLFGAHDPIEGSEVVQTFERGC